MGVAAVLFFAGLAFVRSQATVDDVAYMRAMIPYHSIAILTSERARIKDPRVRELENGIIETQRKGLAQVSRDERARLSRTDCSGPRADGGKHTQRRRERPVT